MEVRTTAYFREFLDFAYLWNHDHGHEVPPSYRPTAANADLWTQLNEDLPANLFELCPMHLLGRLVDRPQKADQNHPLVLTVSLNPGRNQIAEPLEQQHGIFEELGDNGQTLIDRTASYFQTVGANGSFWRIISRVSRQSLINAPFQNAMIPAWMDQSVAHVDLWPLRLGAFDPFIAHQADFPPAFHRTHRQGMLIELIGTAAADLTLVLGDNADLGLPVAALPPLPTIVLRHPRTQRAIPQLEVFRVLELAGCYRIPHPARRGVCNVQWDNVAERIRNDLN